MLILKSGSLVVLDSVNKEARSQWLDTSNRWDFWVPGGERRYREREGAFAAMHWDEKKAAVMLGYRQQDLQPLPWS